MTQQIESQALAAIRKSLGLGGGGEQQQFLNDGSVEQVLSIGDIVRRSRTLANTAGIHFGVLENVHGAANSKTSDVNPYNAGDSAVAPFPSTVSDSLEVWVMHSTVVRTSGAGELTFGMLTLGLPGSNQAFGEDANGNPVTIAAGAELPIAAWDGISVSGTAIGFNTGHLPGAGRAFRIPRGLGALPVLTFLSTSSASATFQCRMLIGLFPIAFGQDGVT